MKIAEFGVESWLNRWEKSAQYDISQSTISALTLKELFTITKTDPQQFIDQIFQSPMNYGWIEGSPQFKQQVCQLYDHVHPQQVLQTNGATGANYLALYSLIEPGDHVISEYPSYQQMFDIPKSLGAKVDLWHIHESHNWYPSIQELKQLVRPDTKLICLNNANNPTGTLLKRDFLEDRKSVV